MFELSELSKDIEKWRYETGDAERAVNYDRTSSVNRLIRARAALSALQDLQTRLLKEGKVF